MILLWVTTTYRDNNFLRFDLIYLILDKADEQTDRHLARHIVALHFEDPEVFNLLQQAWVTDINLNPTFIILDWS